MIELERDEAKCRANLAKHGLDFADALEFDWSEAVIIPDHRFDYGEERLLAFSMFRGRVHSIAYVNRGACRRLISFRRANEREVQRYETKKARS